MKNFLKKVNNYLWVVYLILATMAVAVIYALIDNFKLGGLLGDLTDGKKEKPLVDPERKNDDGSVILPGESDKKGYVQIPESGIINLEGNEIKVDDKEIKLPTGVQPKEVKEVIVIKPIVRDTKDGDTIMDISDLIEELEKMK